MFRLKRFVLLILFLEFLLLSRGSAKYIWPIDGKILLNSNFAECRPNHFHAGIDIHAFKGTPLKAIENGYIWHISVNPFGYGKSLFLKLDDGRTVVYGHLERFNREIETLVALEQKRRFSYRVSLYFKKGQIGVKKGEIIGYVGRTAAVGAHLHFEMRDALNRPINPLTYGYRIVDSTPPLIKGVQLIPLDDSSFVGGIPFPVIVNPYFNGYYYTYDDTINISGRIGFAILCEDYQNRHPMRLNSKRVELYINGETRFASIFNYFSYEYTKEVELEFDYTLYNAGFGRFHRLYIYGDNHLLFYKERDGIINSEKLREINEIKIVCYDANNNRAVLVLYIKKGYGRKGCSISNSHYFNENELSFYRNIVALTGKKPTKTIKAKSIIPLENGSLKRGGLSTLFFRMLPEDEAICSLIVKCSKERFVYTFNYNTIFKNKSGDITSPDRKFVVTIKKGSLYEDLYARIKKINEELPPGLKLLRGFYSVEPPGAVFKDELKILFPYPETSLKRIGIYKKTSDGWLFLGAKYDRVENTYVANSKHLGIFALLEDNSAPDISDFQTIKEGSLIKKISFKVKDIGTGFKISDIHIFLDNIPYIPVYNPFRDEVNYLLFDKKIKEGGHTAEIKISDRAGNKSSLAVSF